MAVVVDRRHRTRHPARRHRPHLRPVLHHQARGRGHGPRPLDQLRDRQEARRRDRAESPAGRRGGLHRSACPSSAGRRAVSGDGHRPHRRRRAAGPRLARGAPRHGLPRAPRRPPRRRRSTCSPQEDVAVVVSDQRMPGMTGTELLARCREVAPDTVRVLLTAFTDADALMESINAAKIYHFLLKPWDPNELRPHRPAAGSSATGLPREREQLAARPGGEERRPRGDARRICARTQDRDLSARRRCAPSSSATSRRGSPTIALGNPRPPRAARRLARGHGALRGHPRLHAAHRDHAGARGDPAPRRATSPR